MNVTGQLGRLVRDPIVRTTSTGKKVASLTIVVDRAGDYDSTTGKFKDGFFEVEAWGTTAELIEKYAVKGKQITVTGALKHHRWVDEKTGNNRDQVKIVANVIQFVSGSRETVEEVDDLVDEGNQEYDPFS